MFNKLQGALSRIVLFGGVALFSLTPGLAVKSAPSPAFQSNCRLIILADVNDPYYPLAKEIAATENRPIIHTISDVTACYPEFLVWVASPSFLSDSAMIEAGLKMKEQPYAISIGIITGSTIEDARNLWKRHSQVQGRKFFAVNATYPSAHVYEGRIIEFTQKQQMLSSLTKDSFENVLQTADYLTFTGHGGNTYIAFDEDTKFTSADVPPLPAVLVSTGSCQTLRPWNEDSIARKFVDQGAAAYSGFVFSPNEGYLLGEFDGLPFRYTWSDFTIGQVIQVQNRGIVQGFAAFPFQYLLGDPRIALQTAPPYQLVDDHQEAEQRILTFRDVPAGVIPIRVSGGAAYRFVKVVGGTAAAEQDPFYNSRLQMVNIQNDKLILLVYRGGDLTLQLHPESPWYWFLADIILDSLDHTFIFAQQTGGDILTLGFALIPLAWAGWQLFRRRLSWQNLKLAMAIGTGACSLQAIYVLIRLDQVTITSKVVVFSPLSLVAAFLLGLCGTLIYVRAHSLAGKAAALLTMTFTSWVAAVFAGTVVGIFNMFFSIPQLGTALYNYSIGILPAISFLITFVLASLTLRFSAGINATKPLDMLR